MKHCYYCGNVVSDEKINDGGGPEFGETHYFCSINCKNNYIKAQKAKNPNFKTGEEKETAFIQTLIIAILFPILAVKWIIGALKEPKLPKKVFKLVGTGVLLVLWFIIVVPLVFKKSSATPKEPVTPIELEAPVTNTAE